GVQSPLPLVAISTVPRPSQVMSKTCPFLAFVGSALAGPAIRPDVVKAARTTVAPAAILVNFITMIPPVARLSPTADPDETVDLLSASFRLWRSVRARTMGAGGTRVMP